ncbi:MAG: DUF362 domain-containing protein [candidate division Zixibacteria bacterium]
MAEDKLTRREFLRRVGYYAGGVMAVANTPFENLVQWNPVESKNASNVFYVKNGTPAQNVEKIFDIMGGIGNFIGGDDVVVIKPNCQQVLQGGTNTDCLKGLIDTILNIPGFTGEIILAENIHKTSPDTSTNNLWNTPDMTHNGAMNVSTLLNYYENNRGLYPAIHDHGGEINVSKYHLLDVGRGSQEVTGPSDGDGYVRRTDLEYFVPEGGWEFNQNLSYPSTIMTYPIFTSTHSGITVDIKNGCWQGGQYLSTKCFFIMMSALNFHSGYAGVTSAVKNYYGLVELSGAFYGQYSDFHRIGFPAGGGAVGMFVKHIRRADLYITTAEWCGHQGRQDPNPIQTKTVLASTDPVALDYWASKHIVYPLGGWRQTYNDPDNMAGPLRKYMNNYLTEVDWGTIDEAQMVVQGYDFNSPSVTRSDIDRKIMQFRNGQATEQEVLNLIEQYKNGK